MIKLLLNCLFLHTLIECSSLCDMWIVQVYLCSFFLDIFCQHKVHYRCHFWRVCLIFLNGYFTGEVYSIWWNSFEKKIKLFKEFCFQLIDSSIRTLMLLLGIQRWAVHIPDCILHCYWSKLSLFIGYSVHFTLILVNCNPVNENTCTFEEPVFFYLLYKVFFVNIFKDQEVICVWLNVAHCTLK